MLSVLLILAISNYQSHLKFVAPEETVFAGRTAFALESSVPDEDILGLELFVNNKPVFYFDERPFEAEIDMSGHPAGPVRVKAVLTLFGDQSYTAVLEGRNIPHFEHDSVQLVRVPVMLEQSADVDLEDFTLLEDGKPQKLEMLYDREQALRLVVVLDLSGSMENFLPMLRRGMMELLQSLRPEDSIQIMGFNHGVYEISPPETDKDLVKRSLYRMEAGGSTNLYGAVWSGVNATGKSSQRRALIVFTDGHHELDGMEDLYGKTRDDCVALARERGVPIFSMGLGTAVNPDEINEFASATGGRAFFVKNMKTIRRAFQTIGEELRRQYLLCYYSQSPKSGWRRIEVTMSGKPSLRHPGKLYFK